MEDLSVDETVLFLHFLLIPLFSKGENEDLKVGEGE